MDALFADTKNEKQFQEQAIRFLRWKLKLNYINHYEIRLNIYPPMYLLHDELALEFGELNFICRVHGDGNYSFR